MADINVGRLSLKLSGLSESQSKRLAQMIAANLSQADLDHKQRIDISHLKISADATNQQDLSELSGKIVGQILEEITRH